MENIATLAGHPRSIISMLTPEAIQRFEGKLVLDGFGCWVWTGCTGPRGYGVFKLARGVTRQAHRIAHAIHRGEPGELSVLHACDNPVCCEPEHLCLGTYQENMDHARRGMMPSLAHPAWIERATRDWPAGSRPTPRLSRRNGGVIHGVGA